MWTAQFFLKNILSKLQQQKFKFYKKEFDANVKIYELVSIVFFGYNILKAFFQINVQMCCC